MDVHCSLELKKKKKNYSLPGCLCACDGCVVDILFSCSKYFILL